MTPQKVQLASMTTLLPGTIRSRELIKFRTIAAALRYLVARSERDCSNPYFPGTKCISSCCRGRLRSRREPILADLRHQAGRSTGVRDREAFDPIQLI
jgi:hypothetical protein